MTCSQTESALALWVGNDLEEAQVPAVKAHLAMCASCRAHWHSLQAAQTALQQISRRELPATATTGLQAAVATQLTLQVRRQPREQDVPSWTVLSGWSAACALVLWLAVSTPYAPPLGGSEDWTGVPVIQVEAEPVSLQHPSIPITPASWPNQSGTLGQQTLAPQFGADRAWTANSPWIVAPEQSHQLPWSTRHPRSL